MQTSAQLLQAERRSSALQHLVKDYDLDDQIEYLGQGVNMVPEIAQRALVAEDGERFSLLLAGIPRTPLFRPTVFSIAMRRSAGLAANTLARDDGALMHLLHWADIHEIDLEGRFARGEFLTPTEVQSFARATKQSLKQLRSTRPSPRQTPNLKSRSPVALHAGLQKQPALPR